MGIEYSHKMKTCHCLLFGCHVAVGDMALCLPSCRHSLPAECGDMALLHHSCCLGACCACHGWCLAVLGCGWWWPLVTVLWYIHIHIYIYLWFPFNSLSICGISFYFLNQLFYVYESPSSMRIYTQTQHVWSYMMWHDHLMIFGEQTLDKRSRTKYARQGLQIW